eukprot:1000415-Amphidinium_carterae.1
MVCIGALSRKVDQNVHVRGSQLNWTQNHSLKTHCAVTPIRSTMITTNTMTTTIASDKCS